jgi:hypothetical protein
MDVFDHGKNSGRRNPEKQHVGRMFSTEGSSVGGILEFWEWQNSSSLGKSIDRASCIHKIPKSLLIRKFPSSSSIFGLFLLNSHHCPPVDDLASKFFSNELIDTELGVAKDDCRGERGPGASPWQKEEKIIGKKKIVGTLVQTLGRKNAKWRNGRHDSAMEKKVAES